MKLEEKVLMVNIWQENNGLNKQLYGEERFKFSNTTEINRKKHHPIFFQSFDSSEQ